MATRITWALLSTGRRCWWFTDEQVWLCLRHPQLSKFKAVFTGWETWSLYLKSSGWELFRHRDRSSKAKKESETGICCSMLTEWHVSGRLSVRRQQRRWVQVSWASCITSSTVSSALYFQIAAECLQSCYQPFRYFEVNKFSKAEQQKNYLHTAKRNPFFTQSKAIKQILNRKKSEGYLFCEVFFAGGETDRT